MLYVSFVAAGSQVFDNRAQHAPSGKQPWGTNAALIVVIFLALCLSSERT
jgi:hypothetical protein